MEGHIKEKDNESPGFQIGSRMTKEGGRPVDSPVLSSYSHPRTPTACFGNNGLSKDGIKSTDQVGALRAIEGFKEPRLNVDCHVYEGSNANDLNIDALAGGEGHCPKSDGISSYPPGFEPHVYHSGELSGENSIPPGFGENISSKVSKVRKGCTLKRHSDCVEKRVTRSQTKQCKESALQSKRASNRRLPSEGGREASPQVSESAKTTDSMQKLAEDSLQMGEMLGLKVIANRENAVKRITQSLKSERASRFNRK